MTANPVLCSVQTATKRCRAGARLLEAPDPPQTVLPAEMPAALLLFPEQACSLAALSCLKPKTSSFIGQCGETRRGTALSTGVRVKGLRLGRKEAFPRLSIPQVPPVQLAARGCPSAETPLCPCRWLASNPNLPVEHSTASTAFHSLLSFHPRRVLRISVFTDWKRVSIHYCPPIFVQTQESS